MTMNGRNRVALAATISAATVSAAALAAAPFATASPEDPMQAARAASARFHSVQQAEQAGYGELRDAAGIACIDSTSGGMGIHYVNGQLLGDAVVDPNQPEALVYEPQPNGSLKLVALEYIVFEDALTTNDAEIITDPADNRIPTVLGQRLLRVQGPGETQPNRYGVPAFFERHLWLWEDNPGPGGLFADWNPEVSCP